MPTFDDFWELFPRHEAKKDARKAWDKLNPSPALIDTILSSLSWQVEREEWTKDDGQFVPLPATWLRGERWTDERRATKDRRVTRQGIVYPCPHAERCVSTWACGQRQLREKAS